MGFSSEVSDIRQRARSRRCVFGMVTARGEPGERGKEVIERGEREHTNLVAGRTDEIVYAPECACRIATLNRVYGFSKKGTKTLDSDSL